MQDDYIEEDFLEEESSSNRRPFLMAVGVLVTLFILMGACTAFFLVNNRAAQDRDAEVAAIETRNAETLGSNAATAVAATETAVASPTDTPVPTAAPTDTPAPATVAPTATSVVEDTGEDDAAAAAGEGEGTEGEESEATNGEIVDPDSENDAEDGTTADEDASPTPISALSDTSDDGNGQALPQTGLDSWGIVVAAFVLIGLLIFARRLRTTG